MRKISQETKDAILADPELGKSSDVQVAKKHQVSTPIVMNLRHDNNIGAYDGRAKIRGYTEHPKTHIVLRDPDLGKMPDVLMAERHSVRSELVGVIRKRNGIPVYRRPPREHPMTKYIREDKDLGKFTDLYIAAKYPDVGRRLVTDIRRKLKIPPCNPPAKGHTERYERGPIWSRDIFEQWGRPKGIDLVLELIHDD